MDAQLNIQNGAYVSAVYLITKMFMKEPHTSLFVALTGVRKTHLALNLLESEYKNHFNFIVIICPTLEHNETYKSRGWVWNYPDVIHIQINYEIQLGRKMEFDTSNCKMSVQDFYRGQCNDNDLLPFDSLA